MNQVRVPDRPGDDGMVLDLSLGSRGLCVAVDAQYKCELGKKILARNVSLLELKSQRDPVPQIVIWECTPSEQALPERWIIS